MEMPYRLLLTGGLAAALTGAGSSSTVADPGPPAPRPAGSRPARQSPGTSQTTMSTNGCSFTVTYTWTGFKGRDLTATFGLYQRAGTLDQSVVLHNIEGQIGKGGTVTHTFTLAPGPVAARMLLGRGSLVNGKTYAQVNGSSSGTSSVSSTCG